MEKVLIDLFIVPEEALPEFMDAVRRLPPFLKSLPGFVEGFVYQKKSESGRYNVVTTAVWANDEAYQAAKKAAQAEYRRINFNPQEVMGRLGVQMERGEFDRSPY
jgi:heme-degrading monooxygenase HmoA